MAPLRWGILSAGKISHDFVVGTAALPKDEHQVVAVAARSLESAKAFAKTHEIPKAYGSYEELVKDPEIGKNFAKLNTFNYNAILEQIQNLTVGKLLFYFRCGVHRFC